MKKLMTVLLAFAVSNSYGQEAYSNYQKCLESIDKQQQKAHEDLVNNWYEENPDPQKYATMACDNHGPKFQCIRHHKQCIGVCTCYSQYSQQQNTLDAKFQSAKDACESNYKKAAIAEAAKAEQEKKLAKKKEELEQQKEENEQKRKLANTTQSNKPTQQQRTAVPGSSNTQQQQYQQQADTYLNAANNTTNGIEKAKDLNIAKINAIASKNTAQVAQIQQQQNQQTAQNINDLGNQLIAIINKPKPEEYHKPSREEQKAEIEKRVREDLESRGYVFDAEGNAIPPEQIAEMKYDDAHLDEYKRNFTRLGKYQVYRTINITPDSIKKWDNHATQKETMDFIAETIWKYTDHPSAVKLCNVTEEIAFVDSVFTYKYRNVWMFRASNTQVYEDKIDFSTTPILGFSIYPSSTTVFRSENVSCNDGINLIVSGEGEKRLRFWLPVEAAEDGTPDKLVKAFTHLIVLCHGKFVTHK